MAGVTNDVAADKEIPRFGRRWKAGRHRALLDRAMRARRNGQLDESFELLEQIVRNEPSHLEASRTLWDVAVALGKAPEAAAALITALRHEVRSNASDAAVRHWLELLEHATDTEVEAELLVSIARFAQAAGHPVESCEAIRRGLRDPAARSSPDIALGLVEGARGLDLELTLEAAKLAVQVEGIGAEPQEHLRELIRELEFAGPDSGTPEPEPDTLESVFDADPAPDAGVTEAIFGSFTPDPSTDPPPLRDLTSELANEYFDDVAEPYTRLAAATADERDPNEETASDFLGDGEAEEDPGDETQAHWIEDPPDEAAADPLAALAAQQDDRTLPTAAAPFEEAADTRRSDTEVPALAAVGAVQSVRPLRRVKVVEAVPVELVKDALHIRVEGRGARKVPLARIEAISVVAVPKHRDKPVVLVDLAINWKAPASERMNLIRLRGDRFDPRRLAVGFESPLAALRDFVERLLRATSAEPLPDPRSARGLPFAVFPNLRSYQHVVLSAAE